MIQIRRSAIVHHIPEKMFDLVNDIDAYPRRFSWCAGAQIVARDDVSITARLDLRLGAVTQSFTTRNVLHRPAAIDMQLAEGPFKALSGGWSFTALGEFACKVALALDFDYAGLMSPLLRMGFKKVADRMVDEFCQEADRAYSANA